MQSELFFYSDSLDNGPLFIGIKTDELFSKTEQFFALLYIYRYSMSSADATFFVLSKMA